MQTKDLHANMSESLSKTFAAVHTFSSVQFHHVHALLPPHDTAWSTASIEQFSCRTLHLSPGRGKCRGAVLAGPHSSVWKLSFAAVTTSISSIRSCHSSCGEGGRGHVRLTAKARNSSTEKLFYFTIGAAPHHHCLITPWSIPQHH